MPRFPLFLSSQLHCCVALAVVGASAPAHAGPDAFVFQPYADTGAVVVQYAYGFEKYRDGSDEQAHSLALAWSPTSRWFTAAYAGWYQEPGEAMTFDAVSWVNHLSLIEPASSPVSVGLYLEIERPRDRSEGYEITWGPTFQLDTSHAQANLNLWLQKNVRAETAGPATMSYQWQVKSLLQPRVEWGLQGFGSVGPWQHWSGASEQEHSVGPAVFAKWPTQGNGVLRFDAALLAGLTSASSRVTFRLRTQYQF